MHSRATAIFMLNYRDNQLKDEMDVFVIEVVLKLNVKRFCFLLLQPGLLNKIMCWFSDNFLTKRACEFIDRAKRNQNKHRFLQIDLILETL